LISSKITSSNSGPRKKFKLMLFLLVTIFCGFG
jgi:hypothetical protein